MSTGPAPRSGPDAGPHAGPSGPRLSGGRLPAELAHLRRPALLTHLGLITERLWRAFWPVVPILLMAGTPFVFRLQDSVPTPWPALWLGLWSVAGLAALIRGALRFRWPRRAEALARVDAALPGRPIAALQDNQAIGGNDPASRALWQAHQARMAERSHDAAPVAPDLRISSRDPYGLRLIAALLFAVALIFAPPPRGDGPAVIAAPGQTLPAGPGWEGWVEPPAYAGRPSIYLADLPEGSVSLLAGSRVTLRLYDDRGYHESVSEPPPDGTEMPEGQFIVAQPGEITIQGEGGAEWQITLAPDLPPAITLTGPHEVEANGQMAQPFHASDDFGVIAGTATFTLDYPKVTRRHGLAPTPRLRDPIVTDLPLPYTGSRADFDERLIEDFSQHPWANLPVTMVLTVRDAAGQEARSARIAMTLPGRRFFQPVARAVIEQRRDLLWSHENAPRVLDLLRAIAHRPEDLFTSETLYLRLNFINRQLAEVVERGSMTAEEEAEIAQALWDLAVQIEDGTLADARARLQRAQERLSEAMRNGASPEEIAELMQELRDATDDYLSMLAEDAAPPDDTTDQPQRAQNDSQEVTQDQIQALMDRIQELMEEGRMAEAEALMTELNELLENLQVQQAQNGQGGGPQSPGQQSMEELQETLRDQQELSDEAFRDLQDQFNNRTPRDRDQQGQQPGSGQGQGADPGGGEGQEPGEEPSAGQGQDSGDAGGEAGSLADRQEGLRAELDRQREELPGLTGEAAERAREALDRAEGAMDRAESALRRGDLAQAIDNQSQALSALREGLRDLGQALAENGRDPADPSGGEAGENAGRVEPARRDPLGRQLGQSGQFGSDQQMLGGEDVYRRAEELLQELRRRAGERSRDPAELDYLNRLLERF